MTDGTGRRRHLLTGAGSGIGRALAHRLSERGDRLLLLVRSAERAEQVQADLPGHACHVVDLADSEAVASVGASVAEQGPLDSVVHCAGAVHLASVERLEEVGWHEQLAVNLTAPALLTRAVLPQLRATRGTVLFVNSTSVLSANPRWGGYAASKAGLRAFADVLRAEESEHGVRVTTVLPSRTATPMQSRVHQQEGQDYDPSRFVTPESVADTLCHVLDLPSDATIPEVVVRTSPALHLS